MPTLLLKAISWQDMWRPIETSPISRQRPGNTKTAGVVPVPDDVPEAVGGAHDPRSVDPRTAPENATTTVAGLPHIGIRRRARIAPVPAVFNPLVYIAVYIVEAKTVRGITPYRNRLTFVGAVVGLGGAN